MTVPPVEVKIGGLKFKIPPVGTRENTLRIAERVEERIHEIQARTGNRDSYDVTLMTAMSFAAEADTSARAHAEDLQKAKEKEEKDDHEMLVALRKISDNLRALLDQLQDRPAGS